MKTIRQIAAEIGVSKTAISKEISTLGLRNTLQRNGNLFLVDADTEAQIKEAFAKRARSTPEGQRGSSPKEAADFDITPSPPKGGESARQQDATQPFTEVVGVLQITISALEKQLEVKDQQIEQQARTISRLSDSLVAAQTLHAESIKAQLLTAPAEEPEKRETEPAPTKKGFFARLFHKE